MVSVDEVEQETGYDFLSEVPDDVENVIEARVASAPQQGVRLRRLAVQSLAPWHPSVPGVEVAAKSESSDYRSQGNRPSPGDSHSSPPVRSATHPLGSALERSRMW